MTKKPDKAFGKRLLRLSSDEPPAAQAKKRSGHVALLLMGTVALGSGAYALMPRENCDPNRPPLSSDQPADCRSSSSSGSHGGSGGSSSRSNFASNDSSSGHASGGSVADSGSSHVSRGGFGSFMSHFSGGG